MEGRSKEREIDLDEKGNETLGFDSTHHIWLDSEPF